MDALSPMDEPWTGRWRRRAMTIPAMVGATAVAVAGAPLLTPAAVAVDLARGHRRLPSLRTYGFVAQYLVNDTTEIVAVPAFWLAAGAGRSLDSPASIRRHRRLQEWSLRVLARRADTLLGLPVHLDPESIRALTPGPVVVVGRHVSVFDASLPALLYLDRLPVRGVAMAEMLADPGFDLLYRRTGSVFIPRDDGERARTLVRWMVRGAERETAYVIFPEGRLFRPDRLTRGLERLATSAPERAERLAGLVRSLPPRPGGLFALLDELPAADVVVADHDGLDRFPRAADVFAAVPVDRPVTVTATRIPRSSIPSENGARLAWLDQLWLDLDAGRPLLPRQAST